MRRRTPHRQVGDVTSLNDEFTRRDFLEKPFEKAYEKGARPPGPASTCDYPVVFTSTGAGPADGGETSGRGVLMLNKRSTRRG